MTEPKTDVTWQWIQTFVVGLNLCPFAKRELTKDSIRMTATNVTALEDLLAVLQTELELLNTDSSIETTVLVHPNVLQDFFDYNDFLSITDELLVKLDLDGVYQIASFHPRYQFGGTASDDAENYTNRSPYPMLHLLREASLEKAITNHSDVSQIPVRNIKLMNELGSSKLEANLAAFRAGSMVSEDH